ncbi:hypothetical protein SISSUDRAFT_1067818 [Sistotremastrum suecicum HHB10207 ss-3]|uniref:Uncharacterized protein n=1 Tax=Sistotremastrum suecicum HHB10207 ss-3 TaxID=1314776 RepID=A0A165WNK3_9AGAM|nr:hypothetical protein SISSUDRAFT_1067818 [Sistotremastrum suecicum HHB10207 ss-3]
MFGSPSPSLEWPQPTRTLAQPEFGPQSLPPFAFVRNLPPQSLSIRSINPTVSSPKFWASLAPRLCSETGTPTIESPSSVPTSRAFPNGSTLTAQLPIADSVFTHPRRAK